MLGSVIAGPKSRPRRLMLYGGHGDGKSTFASRAPGRGLFLQTEDGLDDLDCERSPIITEFGQLNHWLSDLLTQPHEYRWVCVDTVDWLERHIWHAVAQKQGKSNIEEIGYGKGYKLAVSAWQFVLQTLDQLREQRGMAVMLLSHAKITKFQDPAGESYDRYEPDLHATAAALLQEWCDEVFYLARQVDRVQHDEGFGRQRTRAVGGTSRVIHTVSSAAWQAKRRVKLPDAMPPNWDAYADHFLPTTKPATGNIAGVVVEGSSKKKEVING